MFFGTITTAKFFFQQDPQVTKIFFKQFVHESKSFTRRKATKDNKSLLQSFTCELHFLVTISLWIVLKLVWRCSFTARENSSNKIQHVLLTASENNFLCSSFVHFHCSAQKKVFFFGFVVVFNLFHLLARASTARCSSPFSSLPGWLVGPLLRLRSETSCGVHNKSGSLSADNGR